MNNSDKQNQVTVKSKQLMVDNKPVFILSGHAPLIPNRRLNIQVFEGTTVYHLPVSQQSSWKSGLSS